MTSSKPQFRSLDCYKMSDGRTVIMTTLDRTTQDFNFLLNKRVTVDGREVVCVAVERFAHMPPWKAGEHIGLILKEAK